MKNATELLKAYLAEIQDPAAAAALFADDGVVELPTVNARAQGPAAIEKFLAGLLAKVPDFRFQNIRIWIETPDQAFGEYDVEALVPSTGKVYRQHYAGRLVAENGRSSSCASRSTRSPRRKRSPRTDLRTPTRS
jgi:ketosteroid isomerase-like protein